MALIEIGGLKVANFLSRLHAVYWHCAGNVLSQSWLRPRHVP